MLGSFIKSYKQFMEALRDEDTSTVGLVGVIEEVPSFTLTTAGGARTLTTRELLAGILVVNCDDAQTINTPTATAIVAAIKGVRIGSAFTFAIRNTGDTTITLGAGSGVTLATGNTNTVATVHTRSFLVRVTGITTPAVTIYSLQDSAH